MKNMSLGKIVVALAGLAIIGLAVAGLNGVFDKTFSDGGIDVSKTACEDIASARQAVNNEFEQRKQTARTGLDAAKERASDDYWAENQRLEGAYHACVSAALTADPCKKPFEEIGRLYEEIMADFDADKGFNEAKFNEREQAKKEYNDCVENARKPEFYKDKEAKCDADLAVSKEANQQKRVAAEQAAQTQYDAALATAEHARQEKLRILDAIEKKCQEPGGNTNVNIGVITTGKTGTAIQSNSPACTGIFAGNDQDLSRRISDLENQLNKAKAAGLSDGLFGTEHIQEALDELREELKNSKRDCQVDSDCGNPEPVCCSEKQVGRAYCDNGTCASEKTDCVDPEICAGKPAQCVAPATGVQQQDGVYISRTIPEVGACTQNLQILNLQQSSPESIRYSIVGNIPSWLHIDKSGGTLPGKVNVNYSCGTVQGFGPGAYTVNGSITIHNAGGDLINTIPFNVSITVTGVAKMIDVIEYNGKHIPVSQLRRSTGQECDDEEHWHANSGAATALDGSSVPDTSDCGYGKTKNVPVISVPDIRKMKGEVRGLESLKTR